MGFSFSAQALLHSGLPDVPWRHLIASFGYTIGFVPPDRDGNFHRLRVGIEPPDTRRLSVRTRPGYFAAGGMTRP